MDIDNAVSVSLNHGRRNRYQKARQHNEIQLVFIDLLKKGLVKLFSAFIIPGRDADRLDSVISGPLQGVGAFCYC